MSESAASLAAAGSNSNGKPRGRVILKLSVQLPDGQKGVIHVYPGSDARELAEQFCEKYQLSDQKLRRVVERHIAENMKSLPNSSAAVAKTPPVPPPPSKSAEMAPHEVGNGFTSNGFAGNGFASNGSFQHPASPVASRSDDHSAGAAESSSQALARARELAVRWRADAKRQQLLHRCWCVLVEGMWERRMARLRMVAHEEAAAARSAEITELHAANARIATLAFAQAGRTPEEAAAELRAAAGATPGSPLPPAVASKDAEIARLTQRVSELNAEVDELTNELITAKLLAAEHAGNETAARHEKRMLERQLVITASEVQGIDYFEPPSAERQGGSRASKKNVGKASPGSASRKGRS